MLVWFQLVDLTIICRCFKVDPMVFPQARPPAFDAAFPSVPRRAAPSTADECRRVGNDLYRAAGALAQSHTTDVEGITFGAEGTAWVSGWVYSV